MAMMMVMTMTLTKEMVMVTMMMTMMMMMMMMVTLTQVAATPNNSLCAVGVAFDAQIGGIRMLDGQVVYWELQN